MHLCVCTHAHATDAQVHSTTHNTRSYTRAHAHACTLTYSHNYCSHSLTGLMDARTQNLLDQVREHIHRGHDVTHVYTRTHNAHAYLYQGGIRRMRPTAMARAYMPDVGFRASLDGASCVRVCVCMCL